MWFISCSNLCVPNLHLMQDYFIISLEMSSLGAEALQYNKCFWKIVFIHGAKLVIYHTYKLWPNKRKHNRTLCICHETHCVCSYYCGISQQKMTMLHVLCHHSSVAVAVVWSVLPMHLPLWCHLITCTVECLDQSKGIFTVRIPVRYNG